MNKQLWAYLNADGEFEANVSEAISHYAQCGADGVYLYDYAAQEEQEQIFLQMVKDAAEQLSVPLFAGCKVHCKAQLKELSLHGAKGIIFSEQEQNSELILVAAQLFGAENVRVEVNAMYGDTKEGMHTITEAIVQAKKAGAGGILLKHVTIGPNIKAILKDAMLPIWIRDSLVRNMASELLELEGCDALVTNYYREKDMKKAKQVLCG